MDIIIQKNPGVVGRDFEVVRVYCLETAEGHSDTGAEVGFFLVYGWSSGDTHNRHMSSLFF